MKIPRDISAAVLIGRLKVLGYTPTRQIGGHIRVTTQQNGEHHLTIPNHDPIKIGTMSFTLFGIAAHFDISKEELLQQLF